MEKTGEFLDFEDSVLNSSGRSTMRDDMSIRLINDKNISVLGDNEQYCNLILMVQFVLFMIVLQSENLSVEARTKLCLLSYDVITQVSKESQKLPHQRSKYTDKVAHLLHMMKIRILNTIVGVECALKDYGD